MNMDNSNTNTNNNPIAVAVDIGTTKICAVAGQLNVYGKLDILAVAKVESDGVLRGVVSNIEKTVASIQNAIRIIEQRLGKRVRSIHVGIAGQHIKSMQHRGSRVRENSEVEISQKDIQLLIDDMHRLVLPAGEKIIHVFPQEYTIDSEQNIVDPVGMSGVRLEGNFHIITGQIIAANNIIRCIEKVGVNLQEMTLEPLASAASVLSDEEKEAGIVLVDIGGGTTDVAIFYENVVRHAAVIPFGGNAITKDIKEGCYVMQAQAEKLKVKFGCAIAAEVYDDKIITIPGFKGRENKEISQRNLALIIQARVEEILDYVMMEIKRSGYEHKIHAGIVVTGGGAMIRGIDKLISYHTRMSARIGLPIEHLAHGYHENVSSPIFSTAIGLLYEAASKIKETELEDKAPRVINKPIEVEIVESGQNPVIGTYKEQQGTIQSVTATPGRQEITDTSEGNDPIPSEPKVTWGQKMMTKAREYFEAADDVDLK